MCALHRPNELVASIQGRDQLNYSDDIVSVVLDSYNDKRTAMLFQVNALGTLSDARINDDGKLLDKLWDTEWEARTSFQGNLWITEIRIPFKSILYKPGANTWGCNFSRSVRANNEIAWWKPVTQNYRISQNGSTTTTFVIPVWAKIFRIM